MDEFYSRYRELLEFLWGREKQPCQIYASEMVVTAFKQFYCEIGEDGTL
jgi:hypothetical protein